jgi:putative transposase
MIRTFRYPLKPTKAQEAWLDFYVEACRQVYNAALEQRKEEYRKRKKTLTYFNQTKDLTDLRKTEEPFNIVPVNVLRSPLKRLDLAFKSFFRRVKNKETPGFPRFQSFDRYKSFSLMSEPILKDSKVLIPKLGYVKFHEYRPIKGKPLDAVVGRSATGWFVSIQCDLGEAPPKVIPKTFVGIDVGLLKFATLSDGKEVANPKLFKKSEVLLAKHQKSLSRKRRGSNSRKRQKVIVAKTHEKIKNQRLDFARKLAKDLIGRYDCISFEDLNIRGMVRGYLSKSINDAAWSLFIGALICKAEEAGKYAIGVNPKHTSQTCSACGVVKPKELSEREHDCPCGCRLDRDHNAAINIDKLGRSLLEVNLKKLAECEGSN